MIAVGKESCDYWTDNHIEEAEHLLLGESLKMNTTLTELVLDGNENETSKSP